MSDVHSSTLKSVFLDENSFATTLLVTYYDVYGMEGITWSPETIVVEIEQDIGVKFPMLNFDKLMAAVAIVTTDRFHKSLPDFIELCNILSDSPSQPGVFAPADATTCAWGVTESLLLWPPDNNDDDGDGWFTEEICAYVGKMVDMEGIINPPDVLRIGLREGNAASKIHASVSDDPETFGNVWAVEAEKTKDINDFIKARLGALVRQLQGLHLKNGNTEDVALRMLNRLESKPAGGTPLS